MYKISLYWWDMKLKTVLKLLKWWPPYLGAGVKVERFSEDLSEIDVSLKLTRFNKNYVGTQFGGSMFSMVDPFYMLIFIHLLGREYIVWDKAGAIDFKRPGRSKVYARFKVEEQELEKIKENVQKDGKYIFEKEVLIKDTDGNIVASVIKTLYVRKKN